MKRFILLCWVLTSGLHAKPVVWQGVASELWGKAENWEGETLPDSKDIAQFGPLASHMNVSINGGNRQVETIEFVPEALPYVISGGNSIQTTAIQIPAGVTNEQSIQAPLRCISEIKIEHNGPAPLLLKSVCSHTGPANRPATLLITGSGNGTIESLVAATRAQNLTLAGTGTWRITGNVDFRIDDAKQTYSLLTVSSGTLDVSSMTMDFPGTAENTVAKPSYDLIDYSNSSGKIVVAKGPVPVAEVRNLPPGYRIVHDTAARKILLVADSPVIKN